MQQESGSEALSLTQQVLALFHLLPTSPPHRWLIAADWLEEEGAEVAATAFREGYRDGEGVGSGYGNGCGNGDGHGDGEGYGTGTDASWA